jgi:tetratricopeptide (TPR) repeat protein
MTSAIRIIYIITLILLLFANVFPQTTFEAQFKYAVNLYSEEDYFDAITEFKRLLFFDESGNYSYSANLFIGLSYKMGGRYSDALQYLALAKINSGSDEEYLRCSVEIIKINILRRTISRALALLDSLDRDKRFQNKSAEIDYWKGWAYIFSNEWHNASLAFSEIQETYQLAVLCDSVNNELYNPQLAKYLSIVPGAGQFYTGEYVSGLISIGWNVLWGYLTIEALVEDRIFDGVLIGSLLWWRFYSGNLQNAEKFALEKNLKITNSALNYLQNNYVGEKP